MLPADGAATTQAETIRRFVLAGRDRVFAPGPTNDALAALDALVAEHNRYRTALETIKRTTKSGGAEAIAREALS